MLELGPMYLNYFMLFLLVCIVIFTVVVVVSDCKTADLYKCFCSWLSNYQVMQS